MAFYEAMRACLRPGARLVQPSRPAVLACWYMPLCQRRPEAHPNKSAYMYIVSWVRIPFPPNFLFDLLSHARPVLQTTQCLELDSNEAALSMCLASFESQRELGTLLCVGTAQGLKFYPRECDGEKKVKRERGGCGVDLGAADTARATEHALTGIG
jgi:hypothetical protein